jgi:mono/diheme cytochrome c family protein
MYSSQLLLRTQKMGLTTKYVHKWPIRVKPDRGKNFISSVNESAKYDHCDEPPEKRRWFTHAPGSGFSAERQPWIGFHGNQPVDRKSEAVKPRNKDSMKRLITLMVACASIAAVSANAADGKALYEEHCSKCHGKDGKGQTTMGKKSGAKDYTDPKVQEEVTDAEGLKAIKEGFKNAEGKVLMKPSELKDDEAKAVMEYMRTFKGKK